VHEADKREEPTTSVTLLVIHQVMDYKDGKPDDY
jgi:hypothetical protein